MDFPFIHLLGKQPTMAKSSSSITSFSLILPPKRKFITTTFCLMLFVFLTFPELKASWSDKGSDVGISFINSRVSILLMKLCLSCPPLEISLPRGKDNEEPRSRSIGSSFESLNGCGKIFDGENESSLVSARRD